jgi:hypothetical protein
MYDYIGIKVGNLDRSAVSMRLPLRRSVMSCARAMTAAPGSGQKASLRYGSICIRV